MKTAITSPEQALIDCDDPVPFLFEAREYPEPPSGGTTVCSVGTTSPVKESGPDD